MICLTSSVLYKNNEYGLKDIREKTSVSKDGLVGICKVTGKLFLIVQKELNGYVHLFSGFMCPSIDKAKGVLGEC